MFWYEIYRVDHSVYLLFDVIFYDFTTECVLSCLIISKPYACSIREPVVVSGRYPTDQELFRLKCA